MADLPLSDAHKKILQQFKTNIADIRAQHHTDAILVKWLKARNFNLKKAEANYRAIHSNRIMFGINTMLEDYVMPEVAAKYDAMGFLGFAKDGSPIRYTGIGNIDLLGAVMSMSGYDLCYYFSYMLEHDIQAMREENKRTGRDVNEITFISDMEGFSIHQVRYRCVIEMLLDSSALMQDHYPEIWRNIFIVNAPAYFDKVFNIVKPIMRANMLEKIHIISKSNTRGFLLKYIDEDVLPAFLGGRRVGPGEDPRCTDIINQGGKVPEEYYIQNRFPLLMPGDDGVLKAVINARSVFNYNIVCKKPGTKLHIVLRTENGSIHFSVLYRELGSDPDNPDLPGPHEYLDENDEKSNVVLASAQFRIQSHVARAEGCGFAPKAGIYILRFSNMQSWFTSRTLIYRVKSSLKDPSPSHLGSNVLVVE